jgi:hypothetical protein
VSNSAEVSAAEPDGVARLSTREVVPEVGMVSRPPRHRAGTYSRQHESHDHGTALACR